MFLCFVKRIKYKFRTLMDTRTFSLKVCLRSLSWHQNIPVGRLRSSVKQAFGWVKILKVLMSCSSKPVPNHHSSTTMPNSQFYQHQSAWVLESMFWGAILNLTIILILGGKKSFTGWNSGDKMLLLLTTKYLIKHYFSISINEKLL